MRQRSLRRWRARGRHRRRRISGEDDPGDPRYIVTVSAPANATRASSPIRRSRTSPRPSTAWPPRSREWPSTNHASRPDDAFSSAPSPTTCARRSSRCAYLDAFAAGIGDPGERLDPAWSKADELDRLVISLFATRARTSTSGPSCKQRISRRRSRTRPPRSSPEPASRAASSASRLSRGPR